MKRGGGKRCQRKGGERVKTPRKKVKKRDRARAHLFQIEKKTLEALMSGVQEGHLRGGGRRAKNTKERRVFEGNWTKPEGEGPAWKGELNAHRKSKGHGECVSEEKKVSKLRRRRSQTRRGIGLEGDWDTG